MRRIPSSLRTVGPAIVLIAAANAHAEGSVAEDCGNATLITGEGVFPFRVDGPGNPDLPIVNCLPFGTNVFLDDRWFRWESTWTGTATVSGAGYSDIEILVGVYEPSSCNPGELAENAVEACSSSTVVRSCLADQDSALPGEYFRQGSVEWDVIEGEEFLVRVGRSSQTTVSRDEAAIEIRRGPLYDVSTFSPDENEWCPRSGCIRPSGGASRPSVSGGSVAADAFRIQQTGTSVQTIWWGEYGSGADKCDGQVASDFELTYFEDDSGQPGAIHAGPFRQSAGSLLVSRTAILRSEGRGANRQYEYAGSHAEVGFEQDTSYWISVTNETPGGCRWHWLTGRTGDDTSRTRASAEGWEASRLAPQDMAFCIPLPFGNAPTAVVAPPGDDCAAPINAGDGDTPFTTVGATTDGPPSPNERLVEPPHCVWPRNDNQIWRDVWFDYEPTCTGALFVEVLESDFDSRVALQAPACDLSTPQACSDGRPDAASPPLAELSVVQGTPVRIRVGSSGDRKQADCTTSFSCFDRACVAQVAAVDPTCGEPEGWTRACASVATGLCRGAGGTGILRVTCDPAPPSDDCATIDSDDAPGPFEGSGESAGPYCPHVGGFFEWRAFELFAPARLQIDLDYEAPQAALNDFLITGCPCSESICAAEVTPTSDRGTTLRWNCLDPGVYYYPVAQHDLPNAYTGSFLIEDCPQPCGESQEDCCASHEDAGCNDPDCCERVCQFDPFCCEVAWDDNCSSAAARLCEVCPDYICEVSENDCTLASETPGCNDRALCEAVCRCDPACCLTRWDASCATFPIDIFGRSDCVADIDCNDDDTQDVFEIAEDPALDCDGNGRLDTCELASDGTKDCNRNFVFDACEVRDGLASDCDLNGILDVCDIRTGALIDCDDNAEADVCEIQQPRKVLEDNVTGKFNSALWTSRQNVVTTDGMSFSPPFAMRFGPDGRIESVPLDLSRFGEANVTLRARCEASAGSSLAILLDIGDGQRAVGDVPCAAGWQLVTLDVPAPALVADFRLSLELESAGPMDAWFVDDVAILVDPDEDGDGVLDACAELGDFDGNGLVSRDETLSVLACLTGPATPAGAACSFADIVRDALVDLRDAAAVLAQTESANDQ